MGKFEFTFVPFGLVQAPAYFQRIVNEVLTGIDFAFKYLDYILDFSPDIKKNLNHLRFLFQRLRKANLKLKEIKCNILKVHIQYFGHLISGQELSHYQRNKKVLERCLYLKILKKLGNFRISRILSQVHAMFCRHN